MKYSRYLYDVLGIDVDATDTEVKEAFRKKAHVHHPDKGGEPDAFANILEAYRVLGDPKQRKQYDESGYTGEKLDDNEVSMEVMHQLFISLLSQIDIEKYHIPMKLLDIVLASINGFTKSRSATKDRIVLLDNISKRLTYNGKDIDVLQTVIKAETLKLENSITFLDYQLKIYKLIIEKIGLYTYQTPSKKS